MKIFFRKRAFHFCFVLAVSLAVWPAGVRAQTPITCGETITNSIIAANQVDQYTYAGTAGQTLSFAFWSTVGFCNEGQRLLADIYNPSGQLITTLDECGAQSDNLTLAATGPYFILVHGANNSITGNYALSIQSFTGGGCDSRAIACGQTINTNLAVVGQIDAYGYAGTAGQTLSFAFWSTVGFCNKGQRLLADIYDPSGQFLTTLDECGPQSSNLTLTVTGTYTILVHGAGYGNTGNYALSIQSVIGGGCNSRAITCGQTINTNLTVLGQIDAYGYAGTAGQTLSFAFWSTVGFCNEGQRLLADVYDPSGQFLTTLDECGPQSGNLTLAVTGAYTILVHGAGYSNTGNYALSIQSVLGGGCKSRAITCGQTINTNLTVFGQIDAYDYAGSAGQKLSFAFWSTVGFCNKGQRLLADIYDPSGQLITTLDECGPQSSNLTLAVTGAYTILVHGAGYSNIGNYGLGIQSVTGGGCNSQAISCAQTVNSGISQPAEMDAYLISACSGELAQLSTSGFSGSQFDVYDPTGNELFSIGPGMATNITFSVSGSYTLLVHANNYDIAGNYSATLTCLIVCTHTTSTSSSPAAGGTTSGGGTFTCCFPVTVCAEPNGCYNFVNWTLSGNVVSTSICYTFIATNNATLTANFAPTGGTTNQICEIHVVGTNVAISAQSVATHTYQVQSRSSLTSGSWSNIAGAFLSNSAGGLITLTNFGGALTPQRFYRLDVTP